MKKFLIAISLFAVGFVCSYFIISATHSKKLVNNNSSNYLTNNSSNSKPTTKSDNNTSNSEPTKKSDNTTIKPSDTSKPKSDNKPKVLSNEEKAKNLMSSMSIEEKISQMFFIRCNVDTALEDLKKYKPSGFILFDPNVRNQTKQSLKSAIESYQNASNIKLLISLDEEGGTVNRLSRYKAFRSTPFLSPQQLFKSGGFNEIVKDTNEKATLLKELGINSNLAPVCDLSTNPNDFIFDRSFGKDATQTSKYVSTVVNAMKENKIASTLKHFPGYGNNVDTHTGIAIDNRPYKTFENADFLPFKAGIESGADSVLVAHNIVNSMDNKLPASLSLNVHKILREKLNFNGVIMTDDLQMDAIKKYVGDSTSAVLAVKAGNDLLISSDYTTQIPSVIDAVNKGEISQSRIDESVLRVLILKYNIGLLN